MHTKVSNKQLFDDLKTAIQNNQRSVQSIYIGYYLQFKVVREIYRRSRYFPTGYTTPYYRSELSVKPNPTTGISQHEILNILSQIQNSIVCYACPMLFDIDVIYNRPQLSDIKFVDIKTAPPGGWLTNQRHFITFEDKNGSNQLWLSEPTPGEVFNIEEWRTLVKNIFPTKESPQIVLELIKSSISLIKELSIKTKYPYVSDYLLEDKQFLPSAFTILELIKE